MIVGLQGDGGSPQFRFQAGSYGVPGGFLPSIGCLKRERAGDWAYHFVLVVADSVHEDEEAAFLAAGEHLSAAFRGDSSPEMLAHRLKDLGYVSVSGFRLAAEATAGEDGFVPAMDPDQVTPNRAMDPPPGKTARFIAAPFADRKSLS